MTNIFLREDKEKWENENLSNKACRASDSKYKANRFYDEKEDEYRTAFQRDVNRIIYSNPFRRLRTKNQVIYNDFDLHNRTRLTHSFEVAQLSRQVARALKLNEDLVEAIALGHDLGHTPFGHAGERALNRMMEEKGGFSHNAQSVWIVERVYQNKKVNGKPISGLNLTYATREGILKHTDVDTNRDEYKKFHLEHKGTLEAQLVNKCDSLAYLYHDLDDGLRNRMFTVEEIKDVWKREIDLDFDDWYYTLINDMITNSQELNEIEYSDDIKVLYKALKNFMKNRILKAKEVVKADKRGEEMVEEMFNILTGKPELLPDTKENQRKIRDFGVERAVVDYIQWLGDNNFRQVLKNMKESSK